MRLNKSFMMGFGVFSLFAVIGAGLAGARLRVMKEESRQTVTQIADNGARSLERQLYRSLSATRTLAAILRQEGKIENFNALAAEIIAVHGGIDALQLVPNGIITQVYPLAGNEKAIGLNLLALPDRSLEARRAMESRQLSLDGPFELRQGGEAVVGRQAVFLPDPRGGERFWGFTAAVIRMPTLIGASNLGVLEKNGYAFQLSRIHPVTGKKIVFVQRGGTLPADPVEFAFKVPNGLWTLSVSPVGGWLNPLDIGFYGTMVVAFSMAMGGLTYVVQLRPQLLRREVAKRTAELEAVRGRLAEEVRERGRLEDEARRLNADLEQRVAERTFQLAAVNQELESFSYSVSHDLRSPLCTIEGFAEILKEDYADRLDENGRQVLMRICKAGDRMKELIDHLLDLSKVSRKAVVRQVVNLSAMAREIAAELQDTDPARSVTFRIDEGMEASGDAGLLRVALENLLGNSWKYTGGRKEALIEFSVDEVGGERVYCVRDNGVGFDMKYAGRLFGVFQRLHGADEFEGTGIGLATVQRIILCHGGRIWAEAAVGSGASFFFTLG